MPITLELKAKIEKARAAQLERYAAAEKEYNTPKIAKKDLIHGAYYKGHCRNTEIARWNKEREVFVHWRTKFGDTFLEEIRYPGDDTFDTFVVHQKIETPEKEIPI